VRLLCSFAIITLAMGPVALGAQPMMRRQPGVNCEQAAGYAIECVRPSMTDPRIRRFDSASWALASTSVKPNGQLLLFMPGTGGEPPGPKAFLFAAADAGYHVISLAYNDDISVATYCPRRPDARCSGLFRAMRLYGNTTLGDASVDNTPAEAIANRLVKLLQHLDRQHPGAGWGNYLQDGRPNWQRIVVCGQSQGAGMAAFIAKQHAVARVILFSSPWDFVERGGQRDLAPWINLPSKTPPARWFGGYHARENMAALLARSYAALKIPQDHIRVFAGELPANARPKGGNPFHGQGAFNPAYARERDFFLRAPAP